MLSFLPLVILMTFNCFLCLGTIRCLPAFCYPCNFFSLLHKENGATVCSKYMELARDLKILSHLAKVPVIRISRYVGLKGKCLT